MNIMDLKKGEMMIVVKDSRGDINISKFNAVLEGTDNQCDVDVLINTHFKNFLLGLGFPYDAIKRLLPDGHYKEDDAE